MDGGAWCAADHGVAKSQKLLSDFTFTFQFYALEKEMAIHSSTLAWKIVWTEEPDRLQSMGSHRVGRDWATSLSLFTFMHWREMATHSSVLAWRIPGTGEPGGLPSMGSHRVGHDWSDLAAAWSCLCVKNKTIHIYKYRRKSIRSGYLWVKKKGICWWKIYFRYFFISFKRTCI